MFIRILGLWCAWHTFLIVIRLFFACCGVFIATMQRISLAENSPPDCFHLPVRLALAFKSCQPLACINRIEGGQNDLPLFYVKDEQKRCVLQKICIELNLHILIVPWKNFSNDRDSILLFLLYMNLNTKSVSKLHKRQKAEEKSHFLPPKQTQIWKRHVRGYDVILNETALRFRLVLCYIFLI